MIKIATKTIRFHPLLDKEISLPNNTQVEAKSNRKEKIKKRTQVLVKCSFPRVANVQFVCRIKKSSIRRFYFIVMLCLVIALPYNGRRQTIGKGAIKRSKTPKEARGERQKMN